MGLQNIKTSTKFVDVVFSRVYISTMYCKILRVSNSFTFHLCLLTLVFTKFWNKNHTEILTSTWLFKAKIMGRIQGIGGTKRR